MSKECLRYGIRMSTTFGEARDLCARLEVCGWDARIVPDDANGRFVIEITYNEGSFVAVQTVVDAVSVRVSNGTPMGRMIGDIPEFKEVA